MTYRENLLYRVDHERRTKEEVYEHSRSGQIYDTILGKDGEAFGCPSVYGYRAFAHFCEYNTAPFDKSTLVTHPKATCTYQCGHENISICNKCWDQFMALGDIAKFDPSAYVHVNINDFTELLSLEA